MRSFTQISEALLAMDEAALKRGVADALEAGIAAKEILDRGLLPGMDLVGQRMETGEMYIPEVLRAAKAMAAVLDELQPLLAEADVQATGTVVIGTVKGDLHDIGKNLVVMMLQSAGFHVHDLGIDVAPESFVAAAREIEPDLLGLSALLTTTMPIIGQTIDALEESGLRQGLKVMIGGAPVNQAFAENVGADGYAPDAGAACRLAKSLLGR